MSDIDSELSDTVSGIVSSPSFVTVHDYVGV